MPDFNIQYSYVGDDGPENRQGTISAPNQEEAIHRLEQRVRRRDAMGQLRDFKIEHIELVIPKREVVVVTGKRGMSPAMLTLTWIVTLAAVGALGWLPSREFLVTEGARVGTEGIYGPSGSSNQVIHYLLPAIPGFLLAAGCLLWKRFLIISLLLLAGGLAPIGYGGYLMTQGSNVVTAQP